MCKQIICLGYYHFFQTFPPSSSPNLIETLEMDGARGMRDQGGPRLRYAMVCASNQNRSMEAHSLLKRHGFDVASYGTGAHVKLPGPSAREPNVYNFGTPYSKMYDDLFRKNPDLYKRNGILPMLMRNMSVKTAPQRWQENADDGCFDVILCFEDRVFDSVVDDLNSREHKLMKPVLIINMDVKDSHEEAANGGKLALDLCMEVEAVEFWEDKVDDIISSFERANQRRLHYNISFY